MLEFFLSSDLHHDYWKPFSKFYPDGTSSRLWMIRQVLDTGLQKANTDLVVFTGDIIHHARRIDAILASFVREYFQSLLNKGKQVIVLDGNHDIFTFFNKPHSILKPILPDGVIYVGSPKSLSMSQDIVFHVLPFYPDFGIMKEQIKEFKLQSDKINILLSHFTPNGAKLNDDFSTGERFGYINPTDLKIFDYCILGDVHLGNQMIGDNIFIPGSPLQHSFGEEGQEKFTWKMQVSNSAIKRIKIPTTIAPEFKTITVDSQDDIKKIQEVDKEKYYVRIVSKIPLTNKISRDLMYIENPEAINFDFKNEDYTTIIRDFIKEKDPELMGSWERFFV